MNGEMENLSISDKYGKRRQITFRLGPRAQERLAEVANLFNLNPSEYAKRVIYRISEFSTSPQIYEGKREKQRRTYRSRNRNDVANYTTTANKKGEKISYQLRSRIRVNRRAPGHPLGTLAATRKLDAVGILMLIFGSVIVLSQFLIEFRDRDRLRELSDMNEGIHG